MEKNSNVRVVGFPKESYDEEWLDTLNDRQLSDTALADGDSQIFEDLREFQDTMLKSPTTEILAYWWYFLND